MFTGLIEDIGRVISLERRGAAAVLTLATALPVDEIAMGDSVAVNGVCLTVTSRSAGRLGFDVSPETVTATTIGTLHAGSSVNLERALRLGDRMGGHLVTGHVDCIGTLAGSRSTDGNRVLEFSLPPAHARYLVPKGSVAIDGISLTVNAVRPDSFAVNIIPHTLTVTTLSGLRPGDRVNLETDIIGRYVERLLAPWGPKEGLNMQTLMENGFIR